MSAPVAKWFGVGCGDNSCRWGSRGGMSTNGGCRCPLSPSPEERVRLREGVLLLRALADLPSVEAALRELVEMAREAGSR